MTIVLALTALAIPGSAGAASNASKAPAFSARGSAEQVDVTGLSPGDEAKLVAKSGKLVDTRKAGSLGGIVFRKVKPGSGYRVKGPGGEKSGKLTVLTTRSAPPSNKIYHQTLPDGGYGYLKTRDGTKLAIDVYLPGPAADGPYPTLVEYSGYGYANPNGPQSSIEPVASILGFAVVDVNMRGTGCSGGAFDYFEPLQGLDGYDVVETVAHQPWAARHKVGMMGVSYGGISQLFVAATRPPDLSAIAPLSVIDNTQTTLYPGGILNTGFALPWAQDRVDDSRPATATTGQSWAYQRIQNGDATCQANQDLHPEAVNLIKKVRANNHYRPKVADPLSPITFVHKIDVPVFMACQWEDEQTGGHCGALPSHFTGTRRKWFTFTNGAHIDSLDPATFNRWYDFLELYVAHQKPALTPSQKNAAPVIYQTVMGVSGVQLPPDPIQSKPSYGAARKAFQKLPDARVLFDNGAGGSTPGAPIDGFERSYASFPPPKTSAASWYLANNGRMQVKKRQKAGSESFHWDKTARPPTDFTGDTGSGAGGLWTATPAYDWEQSPPDSAASYLSPALTSDTTVVGAGYLRAWIKSSTSDVDLQATVSEVRPDGKETFVQSGWLRASERKLDARKSTPLEPVLSLRKSDVAPLPKGKWSKVTIPLYYEGHEYRSGSRIRVTIAPPTGDQPVWAFGETEPPGTATVKVAHSGSMRSRLTLPVVSGPDAPTALPPCPSLRGEPCRDYAPYENTEAGAP